MTNKKHTPAPWVLEDRTNKGAGFSIIAAKAHYSCCGVAHYVGEADARLIAAAPDLLDALRELLDGGIADPAKVRAAHSAIAKATGSDAN